MTSLQVETSGSRGPAAGPSKAARWFREIGWRHLVGLTFVAFAVFPFLFVLSASLNRTDTLSDQSLIPGKPTLRHYRWLFSNPDAPYPRWLVNTLVIAVGAATLTVLLAAMGAYPISRMRFKGRKPGLMFLLLSQMFPSTLMVVAIYLLMLDLGKISPAIGTGTRLGVILVYLGGALGGNVWLMKSFFDTLPTDLDESARVDGASHLQIFVRIILPLAAPILATIFLFSFIFTLNEYALASALLRGDPKQYTLAYGLSQFVQGRDQNWGRFAAGAIIAGVPVLMLFQFLQRYLVSGLTSGAVKG